MCLVPGPRGEEQRVGPWSRHTRAGVVALCSENSLSLGPPSAEQGRAHGINLGKRWNSRAWSFEPVPWHHCVPRCPGSHWTRWLQIWLSTPVTARPSPSAARCGLASCSTCRPCGSTMSGSPTPALLVRSSPVTRWQGFWEVGQGGWRLEGGPSCLGLVLPAVNFWYDMEYDLKYSYFQLLDSLTKASGLA